ncbi:MAG: ABC-2 family transporter protein [Armatimonadetes bacterium]|nr:ABC-2 family transporter protein [Armatimonadota bacterium]
MGAAIRRYLAVGRIYARESVIYPATWIIWILTDTVGVFLMPLVLSAAAQGGAIAGFSRTDFFSYYLAMLFVISFVTSHMIWELNWEIKEGDFTLTLLRPMSVFSFTFARNFTYRLVRVLMCLPVAGLMVLAYWGDLRNAHFYPSLEFFVALILGNFVSFTFVMVLSGVALITETAESIFELHYVPMLFLSGQIFPIQLLPDWVAQVARFTPFYYTTGVPAEILVGKLTPDQAWPQIGLQLVWIAICYLGCLITWRAGLRRYTGVGI